MRREFQLKINSLAHFAGFQKYAAPSGKLRGCRDGYTALYAVGVVCHADEYATRARTPPSRARSLARSGSVAIETRIQPADLVRVRVSVSVSVRVRVTLRLRARLGFGLGLGFR